MSLEFRGSFGVVETVSYAVPRHGQEHVVNVSFRRQNAHSPYQNQPVELARIHGGHFGGQPAAHGKTDGINRIEPQLVQGHKVPASQVPHVHYPVQAGRRTKTRVRGDVNGVVPGQFFLVTKDPSMAELVVQNK